MECRSDMRVLHIVSYELCIIKRKVADHTAEGIG